MQLGKTIITKSQIRDKIRELKKLNKEERHGLWISPNFQWYEFWSGDRILGPKSIEPPEELWPYAIQHIFEVQNARDYLGFGIRYSSGYRTEEWNRIWKGASDSNHMVCTAGDLVPLGRITIHKFAMVLAITTNLYGAGVYNGIKNRWVHFDFGDDEIPIGRLKPLLYKW